MNEKDISTVNKGLLDAAEALRDAEILLRGYEKELARLAVLVLGRSARELFVADTADTEMFEEMVNTVTSILPRGKTGAHFALYFTELFRKHIGDITDKTVFLRDEETAYDDPSKIAFVSGTGADLAYEIFASCSDKKDSVSPLHCQKYSTAVDAVANGSALGVIIPVRNSADGRLRSFYKMIETADLKISAVTVIGDENAVRFALCRRSLSAVSDSPRFIEISLPADGEEVSDLISAAKELSLKTEEISSAPSERDGEVYSFTFAVSGDYKPFILYLNLYHPLYTVTGIYDTVPER